MLDTRAMQYMWQAKMDYIVVFDFECTCVDEGRLSVQEIIEFLKKEEGETTLRQYSLGTL